MNILIITYDWPPRNSVATFRPYSWAKKFSELGANITVLTSKKLFYDAPLDLEAKKLDKVVVIEIGYRDLLTELIGKIIPLYIFRKIKSKIIKKGYDKIPLFNSPRDAWVDASISALSGVIKNIDVVISTFPEKSAHYLGSQAKRIKPSVFWVADYRDPWPAAEAIVTSSQLEKIRAEEHKLLCNADLITAVTTALVSEISARINKEGYLVSNGYDAQDNDVLRSLADRKWTLKRPLRIVYTGTIYEGYQNPEILFMAIAKLIREKKIERNDICVEFYGSRIGPVNQLKNNNNYSDFISIKGHVSRKDSLDIQKGSDLLLILENQKSENDVGMTGKVFEYVTAGKPILCLGSSSKFPIGKFLRESGTGIAFLYSEIDLLSKCLHEIVSSNKFPQWFSPNEKFILRYSRSSVAEEFFNKLRIKLLSNKKI